MTQFTDIEKAEHTITQEELTLCNADEQMECRWEGKMVLKEPDGFRICYCNCLGTSDFVGIKPPLLD
jgi:hypothetical protein